VDKFKDIHTREHPEFLLLHEINIFSADYA